MKNLIILLLLLIPASVIAQPDLQVSRASVSSTQVQPGSLIRIEWQVRNSGTAPATGTHCRVYLSATSTISPASFLLAEPAVDSIAAGSESAPIRIIQPLPNTLTPGSYYLILLPDARNEIPEPNENNLFVVAQALTVEIPVRSELHGAYPVLLIHGLNSNDTVWYRLLQDLQAGGMSYGGNLDFCLNQDGNTTTSNKLTDIGNWTDSAGLKPADFYTLNFDVGPTGVKYTNSQGSNQSAIVKQGLALKRAVKYLLDITGREKLILAGHSMGGLTSREYLQNASNWQADGTHHIAKLLTIGTPHGGSNTTFGPLSPVAGALGAVDESSEAVRDLRYSYLSGSAGVFLFGGIESSFTMTNFPSSFHNYDVNCNGSTNNSVTGLNSKALPRDLAYSCIIGDGSWIGGDGIVDASRANLNNYFPGTADTFMSVQPAASVSLWHLQLAYQTSRILCGLDEPAAAALAFRIDTNRYYFGRITPQSGASLNPSDTDRYVFHNAHPQQINLQWNNASVPSGEMTVFNQSGQLIRRFIARHGQINAQQYLDSGTYSVAITALADTVSENRLYAFKCTPTGTAFCSGSSVSFTTQQTGSQYQWKEDRGMGFEDISASDSVSGTQAATLMLDPVSSSRYGTRYRCWVDGVPAAEEFELKFENQWTGRVSTDWDNPLNWGCSCIPDRYTDVLIPSGTPFSPEITGKAYSRSLQIRPGAMILLKTAADLQVSH